MKVEISISNERIVKSITFVTMSEKEDILGEIIFHELEIINSDVRMREQTHISNNINSF